MMGVLRKVLRDKIVEILTVAIHCKDRTYGQVADEIIDCIEKHGGE